MQMQEALALRKTFKSCTVPQKQRLGGGMLCVIHINSAGTLQC